MRLSISGNRALSFFILLLGACGGGEAVSPPQVAAVLVTPASSSIIVGAAIQLTTISTDAAGVALAGRTVTWASSNPTIASVTATGSVTGVSVGGPVTITATSEGRAGMAIISVLPVPVASISVTPAAPTVLVGGNVQLTATLRDSAGAALAGRTVTWASSNPIIASVTATGSVTGVSVGGPVTITATSEGRVGSAAVISLSPVINTAINAPLDFVTHCPTLDPAYATIRGDFEFLSDGQPTSNTIRCVEPFAAMPDSQLTDELLHMQVLRMAFYMNEGSRGRLPWTSLGLYDWMKSLVSGVNLVSARQDPSCCILVRGKYYFTLNRQFQFIGGYRTFGPLMGTLGLFIHEVRHRTGPGHTRGCPAYPLPTDPFACDDTYDLSNLGSYGVQAWFFAGLATGRINIGLGCGPITTAQMWAEEFAKTANIYRPVFVSNPPPIVFAIPPYGGPCLSR